MALNFHAAQGGSSVPDEPDFPHTCEDCLLGLTNEDVFHDYGDIVLCDNCNSDRGEAQDEDRASAFHGGSAPFTAAERHAEAAKQKRQVG